MDVNRDQAASARQPNGMNAIALDAVGMHRALEADQFAAMQQAFWVWGGLVGAEDVTHRLRRVVDQPISRLARWIVSRQVVNVAWQARTWMPAFQFDFIDMSVRPACAGVLAELQDVRTDWEIAVWFSVPNPWLEGRIPAAVIQSEPAELVQAARADRFLERW